MLRYILTACWKPVLKWMVRTCIWGGRPPVLRLSGRLRSLDTKVLEPDDTVSLMKSITPERNQQELQEVAGPTSDLHSETPGVLEPPSSAKRNISMVLRLIPSTLLSFEQIGCPRFALLCAAVEGLFW